MTWYDAVYDTPLTLGALAIVLVALFLAYRLLAPMRKFRGMSEWIDPSDDQ